MGGGHKFLQNAAIMLLASKKESSTTTFEFGRPAELV